MVCINIEFTNATGFSWEIENADGSWKSWSGSKSIGAKTSGHIIKLRPYRGWIGIENGIQGTFNLVFTDNKKQKILIQYRVDFPAVGADTWASNSTEAQLVVTSEYDNGKYGADNPHNLKSTIAYTKKLEYTLKSHEEDDTAEWFKNIGTAGLKAGINAAGAAAEAAAVA